MTELEELQSLADELSVDGVLEFTPFAVNEAAGIYGFKVNGSTYSNAFIAKSIKEEMILLRNGFNYGINYAELDIKNGHKITVKTVPGEVDYPSIDICIDGDLDKPLLGVESHDGEGIVKTFFYSDKDSISHTFAQDIIPLLSKCS